MFSPTVLGAVLIKSNASDWVRTHGLRHFGLFVLRSHTYALINRADISARIECDLIIIDRTPELVTLLPISF